MCHSVIHTWFVCLKVCKSARCPYVALLAYLSIYPSTNLVMHVQHPPNKTAGAHHGGAHPPASSFADVPAIQLKRDPSPARALGTRCTCPGAASQAIPVGSSTTSLSVFLGIDLFSWLQSALSCDAAPPIMPQKVTALSPPGLHLHLSSLSHRP